MLDRILTGVGGFAVAALLGWLYGAAQYKLGYAEGVAAAGKASTVAIATSERRRADAAESYAKRWQDRQPIILRSINTVEKYAQTDAGRARCLDADRVRLIEIDAAALGLDTATAAGEGNGEVLEDATGP